MALIQSEELIKEAEKMRADRDALQKELEELKAMASMVESSYREEMDEVKVKWKQEVGTLQAILDGKHRHTGASDWISLGLHKHIAYSPYTVNSSHHTEM